TGGKRTAAADVAALLRGPQVADAVAAQLALHRSRPSLQAAIDADVVDSSDVVAVNATDTTPTGAAELANAFANVLIAQRSAALQSDLQSAIKRDERLVAAGAGGDVARRLTTLRGLIGHADPTLRLASEAASPSRSTCPTRGRLLA